MDSSNTDMNCARYPFSPIGKLHAMSADEEGRYWAEAHEQGREQATRAMACNLIQLGALSDAQITQVSGLTLAQVAALRASGPYAKKPTSIITTFFLFLVPTRRVGTQTGRASP